MPRLPRSNVADVLGHAVNGLRWGLSTSCGPRDRQPSLGCRGIANAPGFGDASLDRLDASVRQIVDAAEQTGAQVVGPVPLPTRIEKFTVMRSTFIDKDSREQFEVRTHKRLIDVVDPGSKTIENLTRLNLPAGVDIEIKL